MATDPTALLAASAAAAPAMADQPWLSDPVVNAQPQSAPAVGAPVTLGTPQPKEATPHVLPAAPQPALTPQQKASLGLDPKAPYFWGDNGIPTLPTGYKDATDVAGQAMQKQQAMEATRQLIGSIEKAKGYVNDGNIGALGNTATGLGYKLLQDAPLGATDASQLKATINGEIHGNLFQSYMAAMKAATEPGQSAFGGRIMQSEIPYIVQAKGALNPDKQHTDVLLGNMQQIEDRAIRSAALLNGENPDDPATFQKYKTMLLPASSNNAATPPGGTPPGGAPGATPPSGNTPPPGSTRQITEVNGKQITPIQVPLNASDDDIRKTLIAAGYSVSPQIRVLVPEGQQPPPPPGNGGSALDRYAHDFGVGVGGVVQGVGDLANVVSTPFTKAVNAVTGSNYNPDLGSSLRNALGLPSPQNNAEKLAFAINRGGTAALGVAATGGAAAPYAGEVVGPALTRLAAAPVVDAASGSTGQAGSELARQAGAGPAGQIAAGLLSGAAALPVASTVTRAATPAVENALANAGQQEGVTVNRAMIDPSTAQKVKAVSKTMLGGRMMGNDMAGVQDQLQSRANALGNGGNPLEPQAAGNTVAGAGLRYITQTGAQFNRLYGALRNATADVKIPATQATGEIDGILSDLNQMPNQNAKEISYLQGLKQDLSQPLTVDALRGLRTNLRQTLAKGDLTFGPQEARVQGIADAAAQDITNGLQAAGKGDVANRFQQVDQAYRDRMNMIQNTIQPLIGKRGQSLSGEQVFGNLKSMAGPRGNASGLTRMLDQMTPDERNDISATFADALGKDNKGNFSTAILANNIQKMPQAMRNSVFGPEGAQSAQNLLDLSKAHARVMQQMGGSPTGIANDYRGFLNSLILGGGEAALSHSTLEGGAVAGGLAAAKLGRDAINARLLMSPKIQAWLKSAPATTNPAAINRHFDRLTAIAVREPALAPDIQNLRQSILNAANSNIPSSGAAVASPDQGPQNQVQSQ
jgi:hypothetical protein